MVDSDSHAEALVRWLTHGVTSDTHPILAFAFSRFLQPLGIEAETLEAEPFGGLESANGSWWLNRSRWNPERVDRSHPSWRDLRGLLDFPAAFRISLSPQGGMSIAPTARLAADFAASAYWESSEQGWLAARHSFEAARHTEVFLYAAAALLLDEPSAAQLYSEGNDDAFCAAVLRRLSLTPAPTLPHAADSRIAARATMVR